MIKIKNALPISWGFWLGILIFIAVLLFPFPADFPVVQQKMLAVVLLMGVWWMSEALPLAVTALLPLVLYPVLGIMKTGGVSPNYTHHLVFLFMGGFIIAQALQEWELHRRFALFTIAILGTNPRRVILAFMLATAVLSMWISNTATAIMMLPIGMAVIRQIQGREEDEGPVYSPFGMILMLGIAYSASIGGLATLIGTPPNVVFSGIYGKYFPDMAEITFAGWMGMVLPLSVILFVVLWFYLGRVVLKRRDLPKLQQKQMFVEKYRELGRMNGYQRTVLIIFIITAVLWLSRADIELGFVTIPGWPKLLGLEKFIQDSTIAIGMALLLFIIPVKDRTDRKALLNWKSILKLPWDILLLFGGGFALAEGIQSTGLADFLGKQLQFLGNLPPLLMLFVLAICLSFLTEFTSNTAVATTMLPILAALSIDLNMNPLIIMLPATVATSCAFMLPVATPPNAIVFGSRYIPIRKMVKIGVFLNIATAAVMSVYFYLIF